MQLRRGADVIAGGQSDASHDLTSSNVRLNMKMTSSSLGARRSVGIFAVWLFAGAVHLASAAEAVSAIAGSQGVDARVTALLQRMSLREKISLLHGTATPADAEIGAPGYWAGLPRLGIPWLRFADGPQGISTIDRPATGMIDALGLAATFSLTDARQNGVVIGRDARSLGIDAVLEPGLGLPRDPGAR